MNKFKLYDVVELKQDYFTELLMPNGKKKNIKIPKGTIGVIVDEYQNQNFLIEFNAENLDYYVVASKNLKISINESEN